MQTGNLLIDTNRMPRQTNVEALRILAMSMILIGHFLCHAICSDNFPHNLFPVLYCFVAPGVDIFFFISGYFLIRFSLQRIIKFLLVTAIFTVANIVFILPTDNPISIGQLLKCLFFPFDNYWFIQVYFLLLITSPILNAGLRALSDRTLAIVVCLTLATIFYMHNGIACYNYLNGFLLYITGYSAARLNIARHLTCRGWLAVFSAITIGVALLQFYAVAICKTTGYYLTSYDSPSVIAQAVTLSFVFIRMHLTSRVVNSIATASFGCYLLQDGILGAYYLYKAQHTYLLNHGYSLPTIAMFVISFLLIWLISWLITRLTARPVSTASAGLEALFVSKLVKKSKSRFNNKC